MLFAGLAHLGLLSCWISDFIRIFKIGDKISFLEREERIHWEYALEPQDSRTVPRFSESTANALLDMYYIAWSSDNTCRAGEQGVHGRNLSLSVLLEPVVN